MKTIFEAQKKKSLELRNGSLADRKRKLKLLLDWILAYRSEITTAVQKDLGKPEVEVELSEILPVTSEIRHALANLNRWARPKTVPTPLLMLGTRSKIHYEPKGVVLIIAPWNYPLNLTLSPLVSAIAAGNAAIIKPSERTPATSALLQKLIDEIFDQDEITVIQGAVPETQELLALPFDHIFFTGSPTVGKIIMAAAAKNLTSITLELGGKSPAIIDETANATDAAKKLVWGKFTNCGQTCIAPDYILVHQSKYTEVKEKLISFTQKFYPVSQSLDSAMNYAGIIDKKHLTQLDGVLKDATEHGASLAMGGEVNEANNFMSPTILENVSLESNAMKEEIFGPILPLISYEHLDEAIEIINSKPKPLALYLYTNSKSNRRRIISETSSGGVNINDNLIQFSNLNIPFGGVNNSGIGKSHGYHGFMAFSNEKPVMKQRVGITGISVFYPPYTNWVRKLVRLVVNNL
jgi:aldehyde dehydrogenase (NAD+)